MSGGDVRMPPVADVAVKRLDTLYQWLDGETGDGEEIMNKEQIKKIRDKAQMWAEDCTMDDRCDPAYKVLIASAYVAGAGEGFRMQMVSWLRPSRADSRFTGRAWSNTITWLSIHWWWDLIRVSSGMTRRLQPQRSRSWNSLSNSMDAGN